MPTVHFIAFDGTRHTVSAQAGQSLMRAALDNGVPGIDGDCGGAAACGTCHVYVGQAWFDKLGTIESSEDGMLEFTDCRQPSSRLACQIRMTPEIDGIEVSLPESQH